IPGSYILEPAALERSVSETLTADFSVTGYTVSRVWMVGTAFDDGNATSENIFFNSPCFAVLHGDGTGAGCAAPAGTQQGTLSVTLDIHSRACTGGPCH